jgi:ComF family protein
MLKFIRDFIGLFYPEVCLACGEGLAEGEKLVCSSCLFKLPKTNYHMQPSNPVMRAFYGRVDVVAAASFYYYSKGSLVQDLVHQLKYNDKKQLGIAFGKWYGAELKQSPYFAELDAIIPVPLHAKKLRKRGFNQSACFAEGLGQVMGIEVLPDALHRIKDTQTQTNKSRFERWENLKDVFSPGKNIKLQGKHVLLVDDIITTGATMEACIHAIQLEGVASVSVASIGYVTDEF